MLRAIAKATLIGAALASLFAKSLHVVLTPTCAVTRSKQIEARGRRDPEAYAVYVEGFRRPRTKRCDAYRHGTRSRCAPCGRSGSPRRPARSLLACSSRTAHSAPPAP